MEDVRNLLPLLILCQGCLSFLYACPVSSDGKMAAYLSCPLGIIQEDQKKNQMVFAGLIMIAVVFRIMIQCTKKYITCGSSISICRHRLCCHHCHWEKCCKLSSGHSEDCKTPQIGREHCKLSVFVILCSVVTNAEKHKKYNY